MPQGLQVFNANSVLMLDITDRLTRILGSMIVTSPGSMSVPQFASGTPWCASFPLNDGYGYKELKAIISGNVLTWDYDPASNPQSPPTGAYILYGVY